MTTQTKQMQIVHTAQGALYQVMSDRIQVKTSSADTDEAYVIVEVVSPPGGGPPRLATHPQQETFYILEGEFGIDTLRDGVPARDVARAGDVVNIPGMVPHTFRNIGSAPGRFIAISAPGGMDRFFAELGVPITDPANPSKPSGPPDMQRVIEICARHNVIFVS